MGMYTEIYVSTNLKTETPLEVIAVLKAICDKDINADCLKDKPSRWFMLFNNGSYYTSCTEAHSLAFDDISKQYSLIGKGDIKNYDREIEQFFNFIKPWAEPGFIGYHRYEEEEEPTLVYSRND